ncbi:MAG: diguanylate cyclase [Desulfobacteraceae bacterium]|nr:diguanylate cyclase [Desulfobacteraceae bacterium]
MTEKQRILVVDDERFNLNVLADLLKTDYTVILAKNGEQALERAGKQPPDLILLDIMMPGMDGYQTLKALKENQTTREIPVIFITALGGGEEEEKGLLLGAVDYIVKPFQPAIVMARVKIHLKIVRQRKLLENIALLDGLTEIPNHRSFTERFAQEWQRAMRSRAPLSLGILDVDHFKQYNDTYGHGQGDEVLKTVATVLTQELKRTPDFAARYGGEEFAMLLPETDARGAAKVAQKICKAIEDLGIEHAGSSASRWLTVSIGGTTLVPTMEQTEGQLFETADKMLYEAKKKGRNQATWQH